MGVVWRGWRFYPPLDPRAAAGPLPLALKVLTVRAGGEGAMRELFANEAEALRSLSHPNVVRFYDFFEWSGALVLAMELVMGGTLEDVIQRHRARARLGGAGASAGIAVRRAWYYFQQLLGALAATHAIGVVHRDIKPSNVFIRGDGIVKLGDFGIARLVRDTNGPSPSQASITRMAVGTGAYMSPEQVKSETVDARSDLYSAAIVFYEMLAGRPPFSTEDGNEFTLRQAQVESPPPPLGLFAPHVPKAVEPLLARALAKDRRYRFASAIEMGEALRVALGEEETPEWRAEREIADNAPIPSGADAQDAREGRLATLREFVAKGYTASNPVR
jgi:serine/threonine-protein kinase